MHSLTALWTSMICGQSFPSRWACTVAAIGTSRSHGCLSTMCSSTRPQVSGPVNGTQVSSHTLSTLAYASQPPLPVQVTSLLAVTIPRLMWNTTTYVMLRPWWVKEWIHDCSDRTKDSLGLRASPDHNAKALHCSMTILTTGGCADGWQHPSVLQGAAAAGSGHPAHTPGPEPWWRLSCHGWRAPWGVALGCDAVCWGCALNFEPCPAAFAHTPGPEPRWRLSRHAWHVPWEWAHGCDAVCCPLISESEIKKIKGHHPKKWNPEAWQRFSTVERMQAEEALLALMGSAWHLAVCLLPDRRSKAND